MFSLKLIIYLFVFIAAVHLIATINYWYWTYRWFDIPMHFLGGLWLAAVYLNLSSKFKIQSSKFWINIILILGFVILVGVLWEFFEFLYDFLLSSAGYTGYLRIFNGVAKDMYTDTIGDLFFDLAGGLAFALSCLKRILPRQNEG